MPDRPERVVVVHGEIAASDHLREAIAHRLGWNAQMPEHGATLDI